MNFLTRSYCSSSSITTSLVSLAHQVANAAQREIEVGVDEAGAVQLLLAALDLAPQAGEEVDVVAELLIVGVLGGGAHDEAGALGPRLVDEIAEPAALLVGADALATRRPARRAA